MQSGAGSQELDRRAGPCDDEQRLSPGCEPLTQRSSMTTGLAGDSRHGVNPAGCRQQAAHSCCGCSVFLGGTCLLPRLPELPCLPQFAHLAPPCLSSCPVESITKTKQAVELLKKVGAYADVEKAKVRAGPYISMHSAGSLL